MVIVWHRSSEGSGFDRRNRFSEERAWRTFIYHSLFSNKWFVNLRECSPVFSVCNSIFRLINEPCFFPFAIGPHVFYIYEKSTCTCRSHIIILHVTVPRYKRIWYWLGTSCLVGSSSWQASPSQRTTIAGETKEWNKHSLSAHKLWPLTLTIILGVQAVSDTLFQGYYSLG